MSEDLNYRAAGVDVEAGDKAAAKIKELSARAIRPGVIAGPGGFGGMFAPDFKGYNNPVLVAGCDGVGTKLKIAFQMDKHDTVGIDCVAMSVNDILAQGADPLFFLDYIAVAKLLQQQVEEIVKGIIEGCRQAGCALLGGETAEMPDLYNPGEYDLAGFAVGLVDRHNIVDGSTITEGDVIIGLGSSGLHSNGFSLARKVLLEHSAMKLDKGHNLLDVTLGEELLKPTKIYVQDVLFILKECKVKGLANITGGGLPSKLVRILPEGMQAEVDQSSWPVSGIFKLIEQAGAVNREEMFKTFNMGIGFCLVAEPAEAEKIFALLSKGSLSAYPIGRIRKGAQKFHLI